MIGMFCGDVHISRTALDFLEENSQISETSDTLQTLTKVVERKELFTPKHMEYLLASRATATSPNSMRNSGCRRRHNQRVKYVNT